MAQQTDILIIGGGISGLLAARELVQAGRDVTILDQTALGRESSWAGGGILLPIYPWRQAAAISDLVSASIAVYPSLSEELFATTGIDPECWACGMLICKNPDIELAEQWCQSRGIAFQSPAEQMLQGFTTQAQQPVWLPGIAQVRNPRLLKSLQAYLQGKGVRFVEQAEITHIHSERRQIQQLRCADQVFDFKQLLLCAGAWTNQWLQRWLPDQSLQLPIVPVRGQMLVFDATPETLPFMVLDGDHYLIPRRDGKILAGSTVEAVGFDKTTTDDARQKLYEFAVGLLPDLRQYPVAHHWAGLRPGTPQGIPYIGKHPSIDNLFVNAGHFRNGLVMGPAAARLAADLILGRTPWLDPNPYALDRD